MLVPPFEHAVVTTESGATYRTRTHGPRTYVQRTPGETPVVGHHPIEDGQWHIAHNAMAPLVGHRWELMVDRWYPLLTSRVVRVEHTTYIGPRAFTVINPVNP